MGLNTLLIFFTFSLLGILGFVSKDSRDRTFSRNRDEWLLDMTGLFIQGVIIPLTPLILAPGLQEVFPDVARRLEIQPWFQFVLSFVILDYGYYWNHRFFHSKNFWAFHRLHHSARSLDIFATSRNSLITSFLFIYVWAQTLALFLLKDPFYFLLGLAVTFALDLWRHSGLKSPMMIQRLLGHIFVLPDQHVLHHSLTGRTKNYGANFSLWDKFHGTYSDREVQNENLEKIDTNIWRELLVPWSRNK